MFLHMQSLRPFRTSRDRPVLGAFLVLGSSFLFATAGVLVKIVSLSLPNNTVVFGRNFFCLLFLLPWVLYRRQAVGFKTENLGLHLVRSAAGLGSMYCYYHSIAHLQLTEAVLLIYTNPLFIPLIASTWIRESMPRRIYWAVVLGFMGIALILKPGMGVFRPTALIGLLSGALYAMAMVTIRRMSVSEPPERIVFYFTALGTVGSAIPLIGSCHVPSLRSLGLLVIVGLLGFGGQIMLTKGHGIAPVAQMGTFNYAAVVFATFYGWMFWGESLDPLSWVGAVLICSTGIIATLGTNRSDGLPRPGGAGES